MACEFNFAFLLDELRTMPLARFASPLRDHCRTRGQVFHGQHRESRLREQPLVLAFRNEENKAERAAKCDLLVGNRPRHDQRIAVEDSTAGAQHSMPVPQRREAIGKVIDDIVRHEGIE